MKRYSAKLVRASLALLLSLWISGAGCMFGCESMAASAATVATSEPAGHHLATVVSGDACASSGSHDCCAKKKVATQRPPAPTIRPSLETATWLSTHESVKQSPSNSAKECPLAVGRAVVVAKSHSADHQQSAQALPTTEFTFSISTEQHTSVAPVARLPNRGRTYLRCCVFLI